MDPIGAVYLATGLAAAGILFLFVSASIRERKRRATLISCSALLALALLWYLGYQVAGRSSWTLLIPSLSFIGLTLLFLLPLGRSRSLQVRDGGQRFDERDVIFSREEYQPGTEKYDSYYAMRPEKKAIDDRIRRLPRLLAPGGRYYDPVQSPQIDALFHELEQLTTRVDGRPAARRQQLTAPEATRLVKESALGLGARGVGIALLRQEDFYSHVGRGPETWGSPIANDHPYGVTFTVEMDYDKVEKAPRLAITGETAERYLQAADISIKLAALIRSLGYSARAHIAGSNYQVILPALAHAAGLGELARMGYLITPEFGPRVRLGGLTTDLPLEADKPITFGVQDFCDKCHKCAANCPAAAIPTGDKEWVRGVEKWPLSAERCLIYWRRTGTDCGLCMKVCPYSHPQTAAHSLVRAGIYRSAFARRIAVVGDDLLYGSKVGR